jgi:hypothetical protein
MIRKFRGVCGIGASPTDEAMPNLDWSSDDAPTPAATDPRKRRLLIPARVALFARTEFFRLFLIPLLFMVEALIELTLTEQM